MADIQNMDTLEFLTLSEACLAACRALFRASLLLTTFLLSNTALAQSPIACSINEDEDIICTVDAIGELDPSIRDTLENGFTNNLVYRFYLFAEGEEEPVGVAVVAFAEVFRLYTHVFYITREGAGGYVRREDWVAATLELAVFEISFGAQAAIAPGVYFVAALLDVNPLSEAQLSMARRWITDSRRGYSLFGEGERSFFGTFVSLFVEIDQSSVEIRRTFQSDSFEILP